MQTWLFHGLFIFKHHFLLTFHWNRNRRVAVLHYQLSLNSKKFSFVVMLQIMTKQDGRFSFHLSQLNALQCAYIIRNGSKRIIRSSLDWSVAQNWIKPRTRGKHTHTHHKMYKKKEISIKSSGFLFIQWLI